MLKNSLVCLFLLASISSEAVILDGKTQQSITNYHRNNPNAAFMNKINGMIRSYNEVTAMACEEIAYKYLRDSFLIYQTAEYYTCMKKSYVGGLVALGFEQATIDQIIADAGAELREQNKDLRKAFMDHVDQNLDSLSKEYNAHCPAQYVRFGSYSGSGKEATRAFCKMNTLSLIDDVYYDSADLEKLGCGGFFIKCEDKITAQDIEHLVID
jgi:hypothetical protein